MITKFRSHALPRKIQGTRGNLWDSPGAQGTVHQGVRSSDRGAGVAEPVPLPDRHVHPLPNTSHFLLSHPALDSTQVDGRRSAYGMSHFYSAFEFSFFALPPLLLYSCFGFPPFPGMPPGRPRPPPLYVKAMPHRHLSSLPRKAATQTKVPREKIFTV